MIKHTLPLLSNTKAIYLCTVIFLFSCVNNIQSEDESNSTVPITLSTKIQQNDKSNGETEFKKDDEIGVYMLTSSSNLDEERYASNIRFVYSESEGFIPEKELFFPESNEKFDFICYHPFQNAGIPENKTVMDIDISPDQSKSDNFTKSDFMIARAEGISPTDNSINLTFSHKLYRLNIIIKPGTGYTAEELLDMNPTVTIKDVHTNAVYDFSTDEFSSLHTVSDVKPYGTWTIETGVLTGKSAILIPQKLANQHTFVEITGGNRDFHVITEEYELERGKAEDLIITLVPNQEALKCTLETSIEGWGEPKKKEVTASEIASFVDINSLTFTESDIYQVLNKGVKVAEICKEYLLADNINMQAIVVYPVQNGITNMENGRVAYLLEETDKKHGGTVAWNIPENSLTYTAGNSIPPTRIYINTTGNIETTRPANALQVQVKPEVLTDTRGTETIIYPIVKIGTQYWLKGNLKASKYTDGSSIYNSSAFQNSVAKFFQNGSYFFYNSAAVNTGLLSPSGWRMGKNSDWQDLDDYIHGNIAVLKNGESWLNPQQPVNGLSGFNAVATGYYKENTYTSNRNQVGFWKTNEEDHQTNGYIILDKDKNSLLEYSNSATIGLSVRCIRE